MNRPDYPVHGHSGWSRFAMGIGILSLTLSILVMLGWVLSVAHLKSILPGLATMKFNTAVGFLLSGVSLFLLARLTVESRLRWAQLLGGLVALLGMSVLLEYRFGFDLGLSQLLVRDPDTLPENFPGRMSAATAMCFFLMGLSLMLRGLDRGGLVWIRQGLVIACGLMGTIACVGYLLGADALYAFRYFSSMALHTSVLFVILPFGLLLVEVRGGIVPMVEGRLAGSTLARRLLAFTFLVPIVMGWIRVEGERFGWYPSIMGTTLFIISSVILLSVVVLVSSAGLNRLHRKLNERNGLQRMLSQCRLAVAQERDRDALFREICRICVEEGLLRTVIILEFDAVTRLEEVRGKYGDESLIVLMRKISRIWGSETKWVSDFKNEDSIVENLDIPGAALAPLGTMGMFCFEGSSAGAVVFASGKAGRPAQENSEVFQEVANDISYALSRFEAAKALQLAEEQSSYLAALVGSSDDAIIGVDFNATVISWNRGAEQVFGYRSEDVVGRSVLRLIPEERQSEEAEILSKVRAGQRVENFETIRLRANGREFDASVTVSPVEGPNGIILGASKVVRDITERKRLDAQLRASLREVNDLRTALDVHAIVAITDAAGRITHVNEKFCQISKYSKEELIGQDHRIVNSGYHPRSFFQDLWKTIARGQVWQGEIRNRARDGTFYWVETTIVPFLSAGGRPEQFVAIRADITGLKNAEESLRAQADDLARSNRDLEQFAYIASHDLQEPLRAVAGCVQILQRRYSDQLDSKADELISHAVDGAKRMQQLIDGLLAFSRISTKSEPFGPCDINQILAHVQKNLAILIAETGASITFDVLPTLNGDRSQLIAVLQNLIGNSLKFRSESTPEIHLGAREEGSEYVLSLSDNGIGISQDHFERIFLIFQRLHTRREYPGTGLGLAVCKKIVERHGGRIWLESTVGKGTTFFLAFPKHRE